MPARQGEEGAAPSIEFDALPSVDEAREMLRTPKASDVDDLNTTQDKPDVDLPEKFKGKTAADLARMVEESQSMIGRQSQEIGSLRSLVDQALELKRTTDLRNNGGEDDLEITSDDVFSKPTEAIGRVADKRVRPLEQRLDRLEAQEAEDAFLRLHPTAKEDAADPKFLEFIGKSDYRKGLAGRVADQKDVAAAHELWLSWEEHRLATQTDESEDMNKTRKRSSKPSDAPAMVRGGERLEPTGAEGKTYSRQALMEMRLKDQKAYYDPAFQTIITKAYSEGRVK